MTTLPQTSQVRIARPSPQAIAPAGYAAPGAMAPAAGTQMTGADVWRLIRAHMLLILFFLAVSSGIGYGLYQYLLSKYPRYTATAFLQVQTTTPIDPLRRTAAATDAQQLTAELRTQAALLKGDGLLSQLMRDGVKIREAGTFKQYLVRDSSGAEQFDRKEAREELLDHLRVAPVPDSKLLRVDLSLAHPKDARDVLEELIETYLSMQKQREAALQMEDTRILQDLKSSYQRRLEEQNATVQQLRKLLVERGYLRMSDRADVMEMELMQLVNEVTQFQKDANEAGMEYMQWDRQIKDGLTPDRAKEAARADLRVRSLDDRIMWIKVERSAKLLTLGEKHPLIQEMDKRIKDMQDELRSVTDQVTAEAREALGSAIQSRAQRAKGVLDAHMERLNDVKARITALNNTMLQLMVAQEEERLLREQYRQASDQLRDMQTIFASRTTSKVFWAEKPQIPDKPSSPVMAVVLGLSIFLGLGLALGIVFLRETLNTTVRSPRDIARVGQMNVLGIIPHQMDDPEAAAVPLPLVIFNAPHSVTAEQFRQMRTRLQHASALDTMRSLMVTGPGANDGKTTVACNLAAGLALNGRKILLVDGNFRRPEVHRLFQVGNDQGFSDVLNGAVNFDEVVHETQVPNLSIMPSGPKPMNATELFESQLLIDFIERALEDYDHVVFDTGPLLVVSESVAMAPRVEGVITVVRAHAESRGLLTRMRDELRRIKAEHVGVVLNAVRSQKGGYYGRSIRDYYDYQSNAA